MRLISNYKLYNILILTATLSTLIIDCNAHPGYDLSKERGAVKSSHIFVEHAHVIKKRNFDQNIRIKYYYTPEVENLTLARKSKLKNELIPAVMDFYTSLLKVRPTLGTISLDRNCESGYIWLDTLAGYVTCSGPCSNISKCGPVTIPEDHLKRCHYCDENGTNCMFDPSTPTDGAVNDIDYILYVTSQADDCGVSTLAYADCCLQESALDRPIVGYINICELALEVGSMDEMISTAIHETIHAFGFTAYLFAYYRDSAGDPRTARDANGIPLNYEAGTSTITTTNYVWSTANGDITHTVSIMVTPEVVKAVREHFACPTLLGAEIENQGGSGTAGSHWEQRIFGNEGMVGLSIEYAAISTFSKVTLAALQDSGWYAVNYSMAEPLHWGRGLGCDFVTRSCLGWSNARTPASAKPFCFEYNNDINYCNDDYSGYGVCHFYEYIASLEIDYQYFSIDPGLNASNITKIGGFIDTADYCPTFDATNDHICRFSLNQPNISDNIALETFGINSRCFEHPEPWTDGTTIASTYGAGCYQYRCVAGDVLVTVANREYNCTANATGSVIGITNLQVNGRNYTGKINCPPCEEICWDSLYNCNIYTTTTTTPSLSTTTTPSCSKSITANMLLVYIFLFAMLFY